MELVDKANLRGKHVGWAKLNHFIINCGRIGIGDQSKIILWRSHLWRANVAEKEASNAYISLIFEFAYLSLKQA